MCKEKIKEEIKKISSKCEEMKKVYLEADTKKEKAIQEMVDLMELYENAVKVGNWNDIKKYEDAIGAVKHELLGAKKLCIKAKEIHLEMKKMKVVCCEMMMDWQEEISEARHKAMK